jgi:hypothetical protein
VIGASGSFSGASTRTSNVCGAIGSPPYVFGDVQGVHVPPSSEHSNVRLRPSAEKTNVALVLSVLASGLDVISTGGAGVFTFQSYSAGVGSTWPSPSVARTAKECSP